MLWLMHKTFFDQPIRNNLITYDNIRKLLTGQGDDYTMIILWLFFKIL